MDKKTNDILDFDFGFTAVNADELEVVRDAKTQTEQLTSSVEDLSERAQLMYKAVIPLINNLKANPEKDYIYWPDRYEKLDAFADKLYEIMNGENE